MTAKFILIMIFATSAVIWGQCVPDQVILNGASLGSGIAVGLDTSTARRDWLSNDGTMLIMQYPSGQAWGTVYFTFGAAAAVGSRTGRDMSTCQSLVLEMMGDPGTVSVGIKDSTQPDDGLEPTVQVQVTGQWQTYSLPLSRFVPTNLKSLYLPAELNFSGPQAQTLRVRSIKLTAGSAATATNKILSQFAFGGGWYSALYCTNTSDQSTSVQVQFIGDNGRPQVLPASGSSSATMNLSPRGMAVLEAANSGSLVQGYLSVTLPDPALVMASFDRAYRERLIKRQSFHSPGPPILRTR
jgi:hypothetical protein